MSLGDETSDPEILVAFRSELDTWPRDQALAAARVLKAWLDAETGAAPRSVFDAAIDFASGPAGELTLEQLKKVHIVLQKLAGTWSH